MKQFFNFLIFIFIIIIFCLQLYFGVIPPGWPG